MARYQARVAFHVFVAQGIDRDGKPRPDRKVAFLPGQVLNVSDIPEGHSADDWTAKGLVKAA